MIFAQVSSGMQRLLKKMREVGWGEIDNLLIQNGEPVFDPPPQITRDIALDKTYSAIPYRRDEPLKPHVVHLLKEFRKTQNGTVPIIRIQDGLPIRLRVTEEL